MIFLIYVLTKMFIFHLNRFQCVKKNKTRFESFLEHPDLSCIKCCRKLRLWTDQVKKTKYVFIRISDLRLTNAMLIHPSVWLQPQPHKQLGNTHHTLPSFLPTSKSPTLPLSLLPFTSFSSFDFATLKNFSMSLFNYLIFWFFLIGYSVCV